jgi:ssDNA-binding Zn-finger/Zn-ribbon topoisomerase 1
MSRAAKKAHIARMAQLNAEALAHVQRGTCPHCGTKLVRNSALTGWYQCGAYACEDFRTAEFKGLPSCSFQCFAYAPDELARRSS